MEHSAWVKDHCRVCGGRLGKFKVSYECTEHQVKLQAIGISVNNDKINSHPQRFCHSCYNVCTRAIIATKKGKIYNTKLLKFNWVEHQENDCTVCSYFQGQGPGRKLKQGSMGWPPDRVVELVKCIQAKAPTSLHLGSEMREKLSRYQQNLTCPLCHLLVDRPLLLTNCNKLVCLNCCVAHIYRNTDLSCPVCGGSHILADSTIISPPPVIPNLLQSLEVPCDICGIQVLAVKFQQHTCTGNSPIHLVDQVAAASPDTPLTRQEDRLATSLIRRKLAQESQDGLIHFKTGGQPITFVKVTKSRVPSTQATSKTVKGRSQQLSQHRRACSGGDNAYQLSKEVKVCTREERESILEELQDGFKVVIPTSHAVAMKADLGIPWSKLRAIRKWFTACNVSIASERLMRKRAAEIIGDNLTVEKVALTFTLKDGGEEVRLRPFAYIPDLWAQIVQLLDDNDRNGRLCWHDGTIPEDEIWLKIGGDKGGGTFKMTVQIVNVLHPNSPNNTCVFSIFEAPDSVTNLEVMANMFRQQVNALESMDWRGKKIKVVYCGDYEFLTRSYGISGASGRHCCLWCTKKSKDLKRPLSDVGPGQLRSDTSMAADLASFRANGANLNEAKHYNNVIKEPLFKISIDQVCPPALHITLGIFFRLFTLFENACNELDVKAALLGVDGGRTYNDYTAACLRHDELAEEMDRLKAQIHVLEQLVTHFTISSTVSPNSATTARLTQLQEFVKDKKKALHDMKQENLTLQSTLSKTFQKEHGPFVKTLDSALQEFHVQRQAYYSGTFVGNHCHSALKDKNISTLCKSIVDLAGAKCPTLLPEATAVSKKFCEVFELFAKCHNIYDKNYVTEEEATKLSDHIKKFMSYYREKFPTASVLPKMHMLEEHVVPWLKKWRVGFGLLGEQGVESIHAHFNSLGRTFRSMPEEIARLRQLMRGNTCCI